MYLLICKQRKSLKKTLLPVMARILVTESINCLLLLTLIFFLNYLNRNDKYFIK